MSVAWSIPWGIRDRTGNVHPPPPGFARGWYSVRMTARKRTTKKADDTSQPVELSTLTRDELHELQRAVAAELSIRTVDDSEGVE